MKLKDKVAIIVGGAGGIGQHTTRLMVDEGAKVMIADMDEDASEKLARELIKEGKEVVSSRIDFTKMEEADALAAATIERFGKIDILVNLAGGSVGKYIRDKLGPFSESTKEMWDKIIDINLNGARNCSRAVINHMLERGSGKIVNTSSAAGVTGLRNAVDYSAAKAGIIGFTMALAQEVAPHGIQVNCVSPGGTATERIKQMFTKAMAEANNRESNMDFSAMTQPEEIARTILFLASDDTTHLVGQNILVAGYRQA